MLLFITNDNNPTGVGLAPGSTIHFGNLEFTADRLGHLSIPPQEWDSCTMFIGMVHNWLSSLRTTLGESFDEDDATSGAGGSLGSPGPRGCNMVTSMDPIVTTPVPESTLVLQPIPTVVVQTVVPQPGMELLPNQ
jgi:hypothetical protein